MNHQYPKSIHGRLDGKRKMPRRTIRRLIASGQVDAYTLKGEKIEINDLGRYFGEPMKPQAKPSRDRELRLCHNRHYSTIKVDDRDYTVSQIEHFGDAVVALSARIIAHELCAKDTRSYFGLATQLICNLNLRTCPTVKNADQFEISLGDTFVRFGIEDAVSQGVDMLKTTSAYYEAILKAERAQSP